MSERISFEETQEYIIANSTPESEEERIFIKKYKDIFDSRNKNDYDLNAYRKLKELNNTDIAKEIYARYRKKQDEENLRRYREKTEAEIEARIKKIREDREKALAKRNERLQNQKNNDDNCESFEAKHYVNNTPQEPTTTFKEKNSSPSISRRVALVISLLLCVTLYLLLLSMVFTTERDTYICYTTRTGECYHDDSCHYIRYTAYETTVYEATQKGYSPCSQCNPCYKNNKTTIVAKNHTYPILISVPISVAVFLLLGYRKKE